MDYKKLGAGLAVFAVVALAGNMLVNAAGPENSGATRNFGNGSGNKGNNEQHRLDVDTAIESGDYQTFKSLVVDNGPMFKAITEENFNQFVEMHNLMKSGDLDGAKVISQELGLGVGRGMFGERGMHNGNGPGFVDSNGDGLCDNLDQK